MNGIELEKMLREALKASAKTLAKTLKEIEGHPQWYFKQIASQGTKIAVLNPIGKNVYSYLKGHVAAPSKDGKGEIKLAEIYQCADGHEYLRKNDGTVYLLS